MKELRLRLKPCAMSFNDVDTRSSKRFILQATTVVSRMFFRYDSTFLWSSLERRTYIDRWIIAVQELLPSRIRRITCLSSLLYLCDHWHLVEAKRERSGAGSMHLHLGHFDMLVEPFWTDEIQYEITERTATEGGNCTARRFQRRKQTETSSGDIELFHGA